MTPVGALVPQSREIVPSVSRVAAALHEAGGTVAWVRACFDKKGRPNFFDHMVNPALAARILAVLQPGAELHGLWPELEVKPGDIVLPIPAVGLPACCR